MPLGGGGCPRLADLSGSCSNISSMVQARLHGLRSVTPALSHTPDVQLNNFLGIKCKTCTLRWGRKSWISNSPSPPQEGCQASPCGGDPMILCSHQVSGWDPKKNHAANGDSLGLCGETEHPPAWVRTEEGVVMDTSPPCCQRASQNTLWSPVQIRPDLWRLPMLELWAPGAPQGTGPCFLAATFKWRGCFRKCTSLPQVQHQGTDPSCVFGEALGWAMEL